MKKQEFIHLTIAENIRLKRKDLGLSQEELADLCELHRTYIGAVERGERNITVNTLAKIAESLKIPIQNLFIKG